MRRSLTRLGVGVRTLLPSPLRRAYRVARSLAPVEGYSKALPQSLLEGCEVCASRLTLLDRLPKGGTVAELGTFEGAFAREILSRTDPRRLHVIDIDYSRFDGALRADPRLAAHTGLTHDVVATFPDATFDWIYVDADHSFEGALRDARASAPKLKSGGLLVFNDFAHIDPFLGRYGVHRAVSDFIVETGWRVRYLALHPAALYDIALQKP